MSTYLQTAIAPAEARRPPLMHVDGETSVLEASQLMRKAH